MTVNGWTRSLKDWRWKRTGLVVLVLLGMAALSSVAGVWAIRHFGQSAEVANSADGAADEGDTADDTAAVERASLFPEDSEDAITPPSFRRNASQPQQAAAQAGVDSGANESAGADPPWASGATPFSGAQTVAAETPPSAAPARLPQEPARPLAGETAPRVDRQVVPAGMPENPLRPQSERVVPAAGTEAGSSDYRYATPSESSRSGRGDFPVASVSAEEDEIPSLPGFADGTSGLESPTEDGHAEAAAEDDQFPRYGSEMADESQAAPNLVDISSGNGQSRQGNDSRSPTGVGNRYEQAPGSLGPRYADDEPNWPAMADFDGESNGSADGEGSSDIPDTAPLDAESGLPSGGPAALPNVDTEMTPVTAAPNDAGDRYGRAEPGEPNMLPNADTGSGALESSPYSYGGTNGGGAPPSALGQSGFGEGVGQPGDAALEGPQSPQVTLQKTAPEEIQVGQPAIFKIVVRNSGAITARNVEVRDEIPFGTRLLGTTPQANRGVQGELVWSLGTLKPGDEITIEEELMPLQEGDIGSVATVRFGASATARTRATKPQLLVECRAPERVLIGDDVNLIITISNPGTGVASNVILEERVPPELQHPAGTELENPLGDLQPNESREVQLQLKAVRAGVVSNLLAARADGNLKVEDTQEIEVLAPQLEVQIDGPSKRFLERKGTHTITISNPGTAPAKNVHLTVSIPPGMDFVEANNAGSYDEATRKVHWMLEELPVRQQGQVKLVTIPTQEGTQELTASAQADLGVTAEEQLAVSVEGIAAILFQVADAEDPIAVDGETTYEIRVVNQGTKAAENVQVLAVLPEQMRPVAADGPTANTIEGNEIVFDRLARLAPKAETTYRVRVKGLEPGNQRVRVQLVSDDIRVPVTKEESTHVFADQ